MLGEAHGLSHRHQCSGELHILLHGSADAAMKMPRSRGQAPACCPHSRGQGAEPPQCHPIPALGSPCTWAHMYASCSRRLSSVCRLNISLHCMAGVSVAYFHCPPATAPHL